MAAVHWPRQGQERREHHMDRLARRKWSPCTVSPPTPSLTPSHPPQLIPAFYFSGLLLIPRQYKQEQAARTAKLGSDAGSSEPVDPKPEMA